MSKLVLIACAGGIGTALRYLAAGWGQRLSDGTFPVGTLLVNVTGCLLVGYLGTLLTGTAVVREEVRAAVLLGFLGGFTTFSTFGYETWSLLTARDGWGVAINLLASNGLGLLAVWLGHRAAVLQGA